MQQHQGSFKHDDPNATAAGLAGLGAAAGAQQAQRPANRRAAMQTFWDV